MTDAEVRRNPVEQLAEEFLQRFRRGERPALTEYTRRCPEMADEIRDLFPALVLLEQAGPSWPEPSDDGGRVTADGGALERLGDYHILREVGRGGMGVVYEAVQESLGRHVALKVLPSRGAADPRRLQRFRREARSAARLHHTNIVPVFEVGEQGGVHYYAMQFIQGQSLDDVLDELRRQRADDTTKVSPPNSQTASLAVSLLTGRFQALAEELERAGDGCLTDCPPAGPATQEMHDAVPAGGGPSLAGPPCPTLVPAPERPEASAGSDSPFSRSVARAGLQVAEASAPAESACPTAAPARSELSAASDFPYYRSVARVGLQVAEALAYAHGQKVLHRDIKPANLLLDLQGTVWVTDFGLAREEGSDLTQTGELVGTLRYMAPERFRGAADARSDLYALGMTLYELLTLRPAFTETDRLRLLQQIRDREPVRPRKFDPRIPRDLETIVLKACAKEPGRRYQSAGELADDLKRFLEDRPIKARRVSAAEKLWRLCRRNPSTAGLVAAAVVLVSVLSVGVPLGLLLRDQRNAAIGAWNEAQEAKGRAEADQKRAELAEREEKVRKLLGKAQAFRRSGEPGQRVRCLAEIKAALQLDPSPELRKELRDEAIAAFCLPDLEVAKEWVNFPDTFWGFCVDATFRRYALADKNGNVSIRRLEDDRELLALPGIGPYSQFEGLVFSPDGRFLHCYVYNKRSRVWKLEGEKPNFFANDDHIAFAFSPDSRRLAAGYRNGTIKLFDTGSGQELRNYRADLGGALRHMRWNPRRPHLAIDSRTGWRILDLETGKFDPLVNVPEEISWSSWHPEGRLFATSSEQPVGGFHNITLWDAQTRQPAMPPLKGPRSAGLVFCFNHAGDRLVNTDWEKLWRVWDWRLGRQLLALPAFNVYLQFSPDDSLLAADLNVSKARLFRFHSAAEFRTLARSGEAQLKGFSDFGLRICLHPNGRLLAAAAPDGIVLVDLHRLEEVGVMPLPGGHPVCFEPAGNALLTMGRDGLIRWNLRGTETSSNVVHVGSPEILHLASNRNYCSSSPDAKVIACPYAGAHIIRRTEDGRVERVTVGPQEDVRKCAVSPDGRWVATGSHFAHEGVGARVWDVQTRKCVADLPVVALCAPYFSSDNRWLVVDNQEGYRIWKTGTWEEGPPLGGPTQSHGCAFSPDSRWLVLGGGTGVVRLVRPETGVEVARLTLPEKTRVSECLFTPDGGKLITVGSESRELHLFDLRAIRAGLRELDLDWDEEPLPAALPRPAEPLRVEVDLANIRGRVEARRLYNEGNGHFQKKEYAKAAEKYRSAVKKDPEHALAHNNLAWLLLTAPEPFRNASEALPLARRAVELEGTSQHHLNTLGVALYRNEKYDDAIDILEKSLQIGNGAADAFDLYFLAMCHAKQGDPMKAADRFDRAVRWVEERQDKLKAAWREELTQFRAEAREVLDKPSAPRPGAGRDA
jgi:serine/threonine protein kinase/WD40 repeat protein/Tfp pilus assembly protein PilF